MVIVGAGPVGLTLALDLGLRGVRCMLVERNQSASALPKMERCNGRTMEIYRRLGVAERIRDAGLPRSAPMDVFLARSLADREPLAHLPYPSVAEAKAAIRACNDGSQLLEPYQLISQYTLEPLLREIVEALPTVSVRFGCELRSFEQRADSVIARVGDTHIEAEYLVGCDGGSSTVRKQLGIQLEGEGGIRTLRQALFHCPDLYESIPMGRGRHYHIAEPPLFPFIILQDSTRHWTLHAAPETDAEMAEIFAHSMGMPLAFETLSVNEWTQHLLCATTFGAGRVFIAGDAAHLVIPTGGLGMNTGVGDAVDLGWKLAAVLDGWGGPRLLESYTDERRPIAQRAIRTSGAAMAGRLSWRAAPLDQMSERFLAEQRKVTEILGIEAGYRYVDSPLVHAEAGAAPDPDTVSYVPTTWPGARLPHVWLDDGSALHDRLGAGFTLLRLGGTEADTGPLERELRGRAVPLDVLTLHDAAPRDIYARVLLLIRPDLHVAWRGNQPPADPATLAAMVTGH